MKFHIPNINLSLKAALQHKIDLKTKPIGALGQLEELALQTGCVQNSLEPKLINPHLLVFAADHGIACEGVSAYPQEVTYQMVLNFLEGGAAVNILAEQNQIELKVVDAGVNYDFGVEKGLVNAKIDKGTRSFLRSKAMTSKQCDLAITKGSELVSEVYYKGSNVIGFGEMGIGNTSSAAMLMHGITNSPIEDCVGRGTGVDDVGLARKLSVLKESKRFHGQLSDPGILLETYGGFEIAMMFGAMCQAASYKMLILVDGFIATSAFLVAQSMYPQILNYAVFCHQSDEQGHAIMLKFLKVKPVLNLKMRLGEGSGCALAYPIIKSSVNFINQMASFESAGVSNKS